MQDNQKQSQQDPLYTIFEHHLLHFQDEEIDQQKFIDNVVQDYFGMLRRQNLFIHPQYEDLVYEEIGQQVKIMLLKKIYGFYDFREYRKKASKKEKKNSSRRYAHLKSNLNKRSKKDVKK